MQNSSGFSLIEVMIAALVTSVGLCGIALLSLSGILLTNQSAERTMAVMLAADLAEIASLSSGYQANPGAPAPNNATGCRAGICTGDAFLASNLDHWLTRVSKKLPGATGIVCRDSSQNDGNETKPACDGDGRMLIKMFWDEEYRFLLEYSL